MGVVSRLGGDAVSCALRARLTVRSGEGARGACASLLGALGASPGTWVSISCAGPSPDLRPRPPTATPDTNAAPRGLSPTSSRPDSRPTDRPTPPPCPCPRAGRLATSRRSPCPPPRPRRPPHRPRTPAPHGGTPCPHLLTHSRTFEIFWLLMGGNSRSGAVFPQVFPGFPHKPGRVRRVFHNFYYFHVENTACGIEILLSEGFFVARLSYFAPSEDIFRVSALGHGYLASPHALSLSRKVAVAKISSRHLIQTVFTPTYHELSGLASRSGVGAWGVGPRFRPRIPSWTLMLCVPGLGLACLTSFPAGRAF